MNEKSLIDCDEIRLKLAAYVEGILPENEMKFVDEHLNICNDCKKLFEDLEDKVMLYGKEPYSNETRKMESKLTKQVSVKLLTICTLVFVASYIILTAIPQTILSKPLFKKQLEIGYALQDLVQFTIPGSKIKSGWRGAIGVIDLVNVIEYEQELIGGGMVEGKLDLAVPIYAGENDWRKTSTIAKEGFGLCSLGIIQIRDIQLNSHWEKLAQVEKWTESRIAVSFEKSISVGEMDEIIAKIGSDFTDVWIGLDTSKLDINRFGYFDMSLFQAQWGFPLRMELTVPEVSSEEKDKNGNVVSSVDVTKDAEGTVTAISGMTLIDEKHRVSQVVKDYRNEMKNFIEYSKYFKDNEFSSDLKKVNAVIQKDDFKIAGFIIQGPTSALLELRDNRNISRVEIIKVDFDYMR